MSSHDRSNRRDRSRWGGSDGTNVIERDERYSGGNGGNRWDDNRKSVSNDQAMEALLASAESRQRKKEQERGQHLRDSRPQKKRWSDTKNDRNGAAKKNDRSKRDDDYYQPQSKRQRGRREEENNHKYEWGSEDAKAADPEEDSAPVDQEKPNFGLSGALASDDKTGNTYNGILLKFSEPPEARTPNTRWRLYVFKTKNIESSKVAQNSSSGEGELLEVMHVSKQSAYLFGRERKVADIPVDHPSLSKQHCVLQYRTLPDKADREQRLRCKPYLMDLGSTNGTFINGVRIDDARYYELRKGDVITLGASTREYVLLTENTTSADL